MYHIRISWVKGNFMSMMCMDNFHEGMPALVLTCVQFKQRIKMMVHFYMQAY